MNIANRLALRWTIGDVRDRGFEMLRLSIACAYRLFGPSAKYLVCVNSLDAGPDRFRSRWSGGRSGVPTCRKFCWPTLTRP